MGMITKLKEHGLEDVVLKLKSEGWGPVKIARKLRADYGLSLDPKTVHNFIETHLDDVVGSVQEDPETADRARKEFLSTVEQMKKLNEIVWSRIEQAKDDPEAGRELAQLSDHLLKQLSFQARYLGNFVLKKESKSIVQNINYIQNAGEVNKAIRKLAKLGYIKVLKTLPGEKDESSFEEKVGEEYHGPDESGVPA